MTDHVPQSGPRFDWSWMRLGFNLKALAVALLPLAWWRTVLHACATQQSPSAGFGLAFAALVFTALADRRRRTWPWRVLLWTAIGGLATTPTVLAWTLDYLTGAHP